MRKEDYRQPPYMEAEWRHYLSLRGCQGIKVYGLRLASSGDGGIDLGVAQAKMVRLTVRTFTLRMWSATTTNARASVSSQPITC